MIFNISSPSGGKTPVIPQYTGTMNVVHLNDDATAGFAEFTSSGVLSWANETPKGVKFDLFCVGGGAGTSGSGGSENYVGRAGAGSGYTHTEKGVKLPEQIEITIGAGGVGGTGTSSSGNRGGATSIGELCSAEGGYGNSGTTGGNGGSGGARPGASSGSAENRTGGNGGSNGSDATGGATGTNGKGQGTPTTDLLGRVHAGGGGGPKSYNPVSGGTNGQPGKGGASDFAAGKGADGGDASGGGGYGGGAAGTRPNNNGYSSGYAGAAGGNGFAMIGWGNYLELFNKITELDGIGVTGTQWIDTGYTPQSDDVVYECEWTETTLRSNCTLFGSQNTSSSNKFSAVQYKPSATSMYSATGATDALATINNITADTRNTLTVTVKNGTVTRVQNGATASGAYGGTIKNGLNVFLFADNVNGSANERCNGVIIHKWKVTDGGVVMRDMIPAIKHGMLGMYDRINDKFYTNAGTGTFLGKHIMDKTKFTQVEYIQSSGTQYINTGFTPNQDTRVYAECVFPTASTTQALFGSRTSSSANQFQFVTSGSYYRSDYNTRAANVTTASYGDTKYYIDQNKNVFDLNGEHSYTHTYGAFTCPASLFVFATNNNGSVYAQTTAKLYALRVYDNGALVRDFIPAKRISDGTIGLWDAISGELYTNAGAGTFVAGGEV